MAASSSLGPSGPLNPLQSLVENRRSDSLRLDRFRASVNARLAPRSEIVTEPEIAVAVCVLVYQVSATCVNLVKCIRNEVFSVTVRISTVVVNPITLARPHALTRRPQTAIIRAADVDPDLPLLFVLEQFIWLLLEAFSQTP